MQAACRPKVVARQTKRGAAYDSDGICFSILAPTDKTMFLKTYPAAADKASHCQMTK